MIIKKEGRDLVVNTSDNGADKTWLRLPVGLMADGLRAVAETAHGAIKGWKADVAKARQK